MPIDRTESDPRQADLRPARYRCLKAALLGCSALVAFAPGTLRAQQTASDAAVVLDPVLIDGAGGDNDAASIVATRTASGSKMATDILDTAASVSVITSKEIAQRGAQTVEEVLQYTAGVTTDQYGSDDRFDFFKIRGFDAYAYRDGLTLGRPFGGVREEAFAFERVEVLKGGNSTTFGISDPGGAVNYVTKRPKTGRFGEIYATTGSFGRAEAGVDFGDDLTPDATLSYRFTAKLKDSDAEYDYSRDDETFLMGGLTWRPGAATTLSFVADYLKRDAVPGSGGHPVGTDFDTSRFFGEPDYNYRGTERQTFSVMLDHDFGGGLTFGSNLRYGDADTDFGYAYISGTPTDGSTLASRAFFGNEGSADELIADARLQYATRFGTVDSRSLLGVEYRDAASATATFWGPAPSIDWTNPVYTGAPAPGALPLISSSKSEQQSEALYLQQELTFAERFIASFGLRHDWMDITQTNRLAGTEASGDVSETTSRIGLTWKITDEISAYGSYAESVVPASLSVDPERGEQLELGVKYQPAGTRALFTAAVYDLTKNNITRTDPITNLPSTIGEVRVRGLDLEAKAELTRAISLTAGYSWLDSEIVTNGTAGNEGNQLSFVPKSTASLWVNYLLEGNGNRGDMTFGLGGRYTGAYFFNDANTVKNSSSFVVDASYSYQLAANTAFSVNVSNLFDDRDVAYGGFGADFYIPGREVSATLRRTW